MAQPYIGEIRLFAGNFEPAGWMFCDGRTLPIAENETLFQLIGTTYGGDGEETFQLPNLQGRIPVHQGAGVQLAEMGGVEDVTLNTTQIPTHSHPLLATNDTASQTNPGGQILSRFSQANIDPYLEQTPPNQSLGATSITIRGGSQPHTNFQPYICINYIISLFGIFPSPT